MASWPKSVNSGGNSSGFEYGQVRDRRCGHLGQKNSGAVSSRETMRNQNVRETIRQIFELIEAVAATAVSFIHVEKGGTCCAIGVAVASVDAHVVELGYPPLEGTDQLIVSSAGREHLRSLAGYAHYRRSRYVSIGWPLHRE